MSSSTVKLESFKYCSVLIDETSQIIEPETLMPISKAFEHFVLVGDHKQLGPTIINRLCGIAGL